MDYYYTLDEEIAAVLWEDIPYINNNHNDNNNNNNNDNDNSLFVNRVDNYNNNGMMRYEHIENKLNDNGEQQQQQQQQQSEEVSVVSVGKQKRKREAHQIQHHIIAERKRRQLLTQRFIALSAIVPGLKKMDKTSILGEAIKYLKQLQEKVKSLEEEQTAKRTIESTSVMFVKKSKLLVDNDNNDINGFDDNNDAYSLCSVADNNNGNNNSDNNNNNNASSYPEIEVKVSGETSLLFKFHCEKHRGILVKLFAEMEKHNLSVDSCCIIPFGSLALDVTIVAQMEKESDKNAKEIVKALHSALRY